MEHLNKESNNKLESILEDTSRIKDILREAFILAIAYILQWIKGGFTFKEVWYIVNSLGNVKTKISYSKVKRALEEYAKIRKIPGYIIPYRENKENYKRNNKHTKRDYISISKSLMSHLVRKYYNLELKNLLRTSSREELLAFREFIYNKEKIRRTILVIYEDTIFLNQLIMRGELYSENYLLLIRGLIDQFIKAINAVEKWEALEILPNHQAIKRFLRNNLLLRMLRLKKSIEEILYRSRRIGKVLETFIKGMIKRRYSFTGTAFSYYIIQNLLFYKLFKLYKYESERHIKAPLNLLRIIFLDIKIALLKRYLSSYFQKQAKNETTTPKNETN